MVNLQEKKKNGVKSKQNYFFYQKYVYVIYYSL